MWIYRQNLHAEGRVFYPLRNGVSVTQMNLRIQGHTYSVASLSHVQTGILPAVGRRLAYRLTAVEGLVAAVIVVATRSYGALLAAVIYLALAAVTLYVVTRKYPCPLELSAYYENDWIVLYVSVNHVEFNRDLPGTRASHGVRTRRRAR